MPETIGSDGRLKDRTGIAPQGIYAKGYRDNDASLVANWQQLTFNNEVDPGGHFALANSRFQPTVPGMYHVTSQATITGSTNASEFDLKLQKNSGGVNTAGSTVAYGLSTSITNTAPGGVAAGASGTVYLNGQGDYVEAFVWVPQACTLKGGSPTGGAVVLEGFSIGVTTPIIPKPSQFISVCNYQAGGLPINGNFTIPFGGDGNYWFMGWGSSYTNTAGSLGAIGFGIDTATTQGQSKMFFQNSGFHILFPPAFWRVPNLGAGSHTFNIHNDAFCTPDTNDFFSIFAMRE